MALSETATNGLKFGATVAGLTVTEFKEAQLEAIGQHFAGQAAEAKQALRLKKLEANPVLAAQVDAANGIEGK